MASPASISAATYAETTLKIFSPERKLDRVLSLLSDRTPGRPGAAARESLRVLAAGSSCRAGMMDRRGKAPGLLYGGETANG